ncbi:MULTISPECIES: DUF4174 domain-containing protein [unclassified Marinobacter]|uniref:DUF4174 domain-containing protein n=1 Tax=unclassified Marinobacter TaxID=83889 RepID=UPI000C01D7A4|nr:MULTISPECIES: DUF4174 domain-containing protein [unclassified Marinobacter]PFG08274.1 uncharacterized protein DUF4174 [Marinobacter sp. LV10MA510-1]
MPSCYSCRKVFKPSALRISYSKNYCESCGVGLFGANYFGFSKKPDPTVQKKILVYLKVIVASIAGFSLLVFLFFSMSAQGNAQDNARKNAQVKESPMVTDFTGLQWKNRVIIIDNVQNDGDVLTIFENRTSEIKDRGIVWFMFKGNRTFTNYTGELSEGLLTHTREHYGHGPGQVVLIGKDGGVKLRLDRANLKAIFLKIDAMPMRQSEMRS